MITYQGHAASVLIAIAATLWLGHAFAKDGARDPSSSGNADNATRAVERAERDAARIVEDKTRIETRAAEDISKARIRAAEDLAKLEADTAKDTQKAAEDAAKDAADIAEEQAKAAEDAADDASDSESSSGSSSSKEMRDLASAEDPEFDRDGFPVRRGQILALDLTPGARAKAEARGFVVIDETKLRSLGSTLTKMSVPGGMTASDGLAEIRRIDASGRFDFAHYYGLNFGVSGTTDGTVHAPLPRKEGALRIGMIDTAVARHSALAGVALNVRDFSAHGGTVPVLHGTAVASVLAREGASDIIIANVFERDPSEPFTSVEAIAGALDWMAKENVDVVNMSLAGPPNAMLDRLIEQAIAHGQVIVAAAGNGGPTAPPAYPAANPKVVAVTAVDSAHHVYRYANHGDYIVVAAQGVDVPAAGPADAITGFTGTSFAAPVIAAYLARCKTVPGGPSNDACIAQMTLAAQDLGKPGRDKTYGFGLIE